MTDKTNLTTGEEPTSESPGRDPTIPALLIVVLPLILLVALKMTHLI